MSQPVLFISFGALIGLTLGLLGGGGSILTVPILIYIFDQDIHTATGSSLAIVGATALVGALAHYRRGNLRLKAGIGFGIVSMLGTFPGVWLNRLIAAKTILFLFALLMIIVAGFMFRKQPPPQFSREIPIQQTYKEWVRLSFLALGVGGLTGFFGVGGGFLIVPALVLFGKYATHEAVGTSLLIIGMASLSGVIGHLSLGSLDLRVIALFIIGGLFGSLIGTATGEHMSPEKLTKAFGGLIICVGIYMIVKTFS
jgi:uncharacterized protein